MPRRILRVILDTNIYGLLASEKNIFELSEGILKDQSFVIYGCHTIRKELRKKLPNHSRIVLLKLYDTLTKERNLPEKEEAKRLADEYYAVAKKILREKIKNWEILENDFTIVAVASLNNLDILFTNDQKTIINSEEIFKQVNLRKKLRTPTFYRYEYLRAFTNTA